MGPVQMGLHRGRGECGGGGEEEEEEKENDDDEEEEDKEEEDKEEVVKEEGGKEPRRRCRYFSKSNLSQLGGRDSCSAQLGNNFPSKVGKCGQTV